MRSYTLSPEQLPLGDALLGDTPGSAQNSIVTNVDNLYNNSLRVDNAPSVLSKSRVQLATMDFQGSNLPPSPSKLKRTLPSRSQFSRLSRTQSVLSEPDTEQAEGQDCSILKRSISLPMPADNSPPPLRTARKPNFKLQLPSFRLSRTPSEAVLRVDKGFITELASPVLSESRPIPNFIPSPLTPPEEIPVIDLPTHQSHAPRASTLGKSTQSIPAFKLSSPHFQIQPTEQLPLARSLQKMTDRSSGQSMAEVVSSSPYNTAIATSVASVLPSLASANSIRIVHQALPYPVTEDESASAITAYSPLINALQRDSTAEARYLHITHALPGKCPPAMIPSSPPVTPSSLARPSNQQSYFEPRPLFSTSVLLPGNYQLDTDLTTTLTLSPNLAVPPGDAAFSLFERIIPPCTVTEAQDFLEPSGCSPLLGRIKELSLNGSLIVVHPTRIGGQAFEKEYLGPILEPVLRSWSNKHSLAMGVGRALGPMAAVSHLLAFSRMKSKLNSLFDHLNKEGSDNTTITFSTIHAATETVQVPRKVWEKWWVYQEKARIDHYMAEYTKSQGAPGTSPAGLVRDLFDMVEKRGYQPDEETGEGNGIEVGVFVVKRTA